MKIITRIFSKKVSTILLGIKIRYKLKKKLIRIKNYTIKYRIIHINNIDNGQNNSMTFECLGTNFFMTANTILNNINLVGEMYLTLGKKLFRLREDDFLFDKCLYLEDNKNNVPSTFTLVPNATIFVINSIKHNWFTSFQNLRVLIIKNSFVQNVCLDDLKFLNYLDLSHNYLENIKITKTLQHCNLSHNNLSWCDVRAYFMDLSYNSITFIYSEFKFHNLNLSYNPLEVLSANGNLINISKTKIKNVLCRGNKAINMS
ncbi:hypothetical protein NBO_609g0003 [Nosema bombycis CQ1]|uniref:Uncharacterized protein n=1 Tax=Nosema bombycis (strain CQ1 / CVCC 102059) TaxID=578461 RepID=R0KMV1_NOSB1|nr:hypothetical protein NBO_609g0003 [Nosema bombycis CQ1]|eukprot:EOB11976.1 hypothetical protein NBO_609g0003 [Nosema bombycis CQ1]